MELVKTCTYRTQMRAVGRGSRRVGAVCAHQPAEPPQGQRFVKISPVPPLQTGRGLGVRHKFFGAPKIDAKSAIFAVVPIFAPSPILDCEQISKPLAVPHNLTSLAQHVFKDRGRTRHLRAEKILRDG